MSDNDFSRNNARKTGPGFPPVEHQFKPGNPGRPKGSRNRLGEAFVESLYNDWLEHGPEAIEKVRENRPADYLKVIASILPRDLHLNVNEMADMSEDAILRRIRQLHAIVGPFLAEHDGGIRRS